MGDEGPEAIELPKNVIITVVVLAVLITMLTLVFYTDFGKRVFAVLGKMILGSIGYTGVFSGIAERTIGGISSLLPF